MKIVIVGAGKVGYFLAEELHKKGKNVVVVDSRPKACEAIANDFGIETFCQDASTVQGLAEACQDADMLVAMTGNDENNLITCQIAKKYYNVGFTISRINNPKNNKIAHIFGVDKFYCSTDLFVALVENEIEYEGMRVVNKIQNSDRVIVEFKLSPKSDAAGKSLMEYKFIKDSKLVMITSAEGEVITPQGNTVMNAGDNILMVCREKSVGDIWKVMVKND